MIIRNAIIEIINGVIEIQLCKHVIGLYRIAEAYLLRAEYIDCDRSHDTQVMYEQLRYRLPCTVQIYVQKACSQYWWRSIR